MVNMFFLPGVSTSNATYDLQHEILSNLDQKHNVFCTFLDLAKAFDAVNQSVAKEIPHI